MNNVALTSKIKVKSYNLTHTSVLRDPINCIKSISLTWNYLYICVHIVDYHFKRVIKLRALILTFPMLLVTVIIYIIYIISM